MKLRKPTEWIRRSVDQTGRLILVPEIVDDPGCSPEFVRQITLLIPEAPAVAVAIGPTRCEYGPAEEDLADPKGMERYLNRIRNRGGIPGVDDAGSLPEDIASGRVYQWPQPPTGRPIPFKLTAIQWLSAAAVSEISQVSLIVEYI